jgi:protein-tyrosine phosphatase
VARPPRYDPSAAEATDWSIYSIPIEEGRAPSLDQIRNFTNYAKNLPNGTKLLVFCESGMGRTACMAAAYWITKRLTASAAITRISAACSATDWATAERRHLLDDYARSMKI